MKLVIMNSEKGLREYFAFHDPHCRPCFESIVSLRLWMTFWSGQACVDVLMWLALFNAASCIRESEAASSHEVKN